MKSVNQREAAERLNLTTRQVKNLVEAGMPTRSENGKVVYPFPECLVWYIERKVATAVKEVEPDDSEEARRRLTTAQARKAEMEVAQLEGQLVLIGDVVKVRGEEYDYLRSNLLAFTGKHAHRLVGCKSIAEVTAKLEPFVHDLMADLARDAA